MLNRGCTQHMTRHQEMFNSIDIIGKYEFQSITLGDNGMDKVKGLCKMEISSDMCISNVEILSNDGSNLIFKGFWYENLNLVDLTQNKINYQLSILQIMLGLAMGYKCWHMLA